MQDRLGDADRLQGFFHVVDAEDVYPLANAQGRDDGGGKIAGLDWQIKNGTDKGLPGMTDQNRTADGRKPGDVF